MQSCEWQFEATSETCLVPDPIPLWIVQEET